MAKNFGEKLSIGEIFQVSSHKMIRAEFWARRAYKKHHFKIYKKGDRDYFMKGKRTYLCEVLCIIQTTTGIYNWQNMQYNLSPWLRWWQFTYAVKVIEQ